MSTDTDFNFSYAPGTTSAQIIGFEAAGEWWEHHLADDVSLNIHVEITDDLPENVIGGALPAIEDNISYADYRYSLERDLTSEVDSLINNNQPTETDNYAAYFSSEDPTQSDGFVVDNNEYLRMTRANAKALNLIAPDDLGLDGYIVMRDLDGVGDGELNDLEWHYGGKNVPQDSLDFFSVALHEIGHILGFVSGIDQSGWLAETLDMDASTQDDYFSGLAGTLNSATPLDMMRFSEASYAMSGEGEHLIDLSVGGNPYLSFDGGETSVADFSTGYNQDLGGDGYQASHWKQQDKAIGIMDPLLTPGTRGKISELDLKAFDAIGWDLNDNLDSWNPFIFAATVAVESLFAPILDRTEEIKQILESEAYDARRGSPSRLTLISNLYFSTFSASNFGSEPAFAFGNETVTPDEQESESNQDEVNNKNVVEVREAMVQPLNMNESETDSTLIPEILANLDNGLSSAIQELV